MQTYLGEEVATVGLGTQGTHWNLGYLDMGVNQSKSTLSRCFAIRR